MTRLLHKTLSVIVLFFAMPKLTRRAAKRDSYIIFGTYDRSVDETETDEKRVNHLSISFGPVDGLFLRREEALFHLYRAALAMGDTRVIRGSMTITGITPVTRDEEAFWMASTGVLKTHGFDTASWGSLPTKKRKRDVNE